MKTISRRRIGVTVCRKCVGGRYLDLTTTTKQDCFQCPSGKWAEGDGNSLCTGGPVCVAGKWGKMGAIDKSGECKSCGVGKYQPVNGQGDCLSCPSGEYSTTIESVSCMGSKCAPGQYGGRFSTTQTNCMTCPSGKFSTISGAFDCITCPRSKYQLNVGQTSCKNYESCGGYSDFDVALERCALTHEYIKELSYVAWTAFALNLITIKYRVDHTGKLCIGWFVSLIIGLHSILGSTISDNSFNAMCGVISVCYLFPIYAVLVEIKLKNCKG